MIASVNKVRAWLLQHPKPSVVRVNTCDGRTEELKVAKSFVKVAESVVALNPDLVEALEKDGSLIRAMRIGDEDVGRSHAAAIPEGLAQDPGAMMLTHMANLVHRAYEHSTEIAFSRLVDIVDRMDSRSDAIERRLEMAESRYRRAVEDRIDQEFERAEEARERAEEGEESPLAQMASAFVSGMKPMPAASAKSNGKASS